MNPRLMLGQIGLNRLYSSFPLDLLCEGGKKRPSGYCLRKEYTQRKYRFNIVQGSEIIQWHVVNLFLLLHNIL